MGWNKPGESDKGLKRHVFRAQRVHEYGLICWENLNKVQRGCQIGP